jgi:exodeoxyribonuclease V alpha subunit
MIAYGRILDVKYRAEDFHILSMIVDKATPAAPKKVITISGNFPGLLQVTKGTTLGVIGEWLTHPKYGPQLVPSGWEPYAKNTLDVEHFLKECVEGFGNPDLVKLLSHRFGPDLYEKMATSPDEVRELAGDGDPLRIEIDNVLEKWRHTRVMANLSSLLRAVELPAWTINAVYKKFGDQSLDVVRDNPYRLVQVEGVTFAAADRIARQFGIEGRDIRRVEGAVLWFLHHGAKDGHLFMRRGELPRLIDGLVEHEFIEPFDRDMSVAVPEAVENLRIRNDVRVDPRAGVYLESHWTYERESATRLAKFVSSPEGVKVEIDLTAFLADYERGHKIELSEAQRDGVRSLLRNRVLVVTGLPGTGKTTLVKAFVALFRKAGITTALMAPTGIAAKRLASVTGSDAATIHRSFGYDGKGWRNRADHKFSVEAVIVDEMSMVDQELFFRVLDALHPTTMLVLVGDDAQLPSVGPGNVLRELLSAKEIPHIRLDQIFRQAHTSEIVVVSHQINRGETPDLSPRAASSEFHFVNCSDDETLANLIVKMAEKLKARDANFQVLSPKYDGTVGVNNLNNLLREALNPSTNQKEWRGGLLHVREGDRLMVIKNDYERSIYNGDMGKLVRITKDSLYLRVHGVGAGTVDMEVEIPKSEASEKLRLAYAITVHKSQGSEFDTVIMPLVRAHGRMRQRNLFYTGVTRAKKKCWVLGDVSSVQAAIANDKVVLRNTFFGESVSEAISGVPK